MEYKKNKSVDYSRYRFLFLGIGLCISLISVFLAFEAKAKYVPVPPPDIPDVFTGWIPLIPNTSFPEKRIPVRKKPINKTFTITTEPIKNVVDEIIKSIIDEPVLDATAENWIDTTDTDTYDGELPEFRVVEEPATFPGGARAWMKFLRSNIKYPRLAKRSGIEGKVFLSFYVDDKGMISDIKVIQGIGGGCDEEAIRVLKKSPLWNPGKQRGHPVKSPMSLFIKFVLK